MTDPRTVQNNGGSVKPAIMTKGEPIDMAKKNKQQQNQENGGMMSNMKQAAKQVKNAFTGGNEQNQK